MDLFTISVISGWSIGIAAVTGLVRFRKIPKSYRPFIVICLLSFATEIASFVTAYVFRNNSIPHNIYALAEGVFYILLFRNWGEFSKNRNSFAAILTFLCLIWVLDNVIINTILTINPLYWIIYSFTLIFIAINQVNRLLLSHRGLLLKNSRFLICICIIIFYSYTATIEVFYLLKLNFSDRFYNRVYLVLDAVNFIINLIFALAILWIPRRQKFILPFS